MDGDRQLLVRELKARRVSTRVAAIVSAVALGLCLAVGTNLIETRSLAPAEGSLRQALDPYLAEPARPASGPASEDRTRYSPAADVGPETAEHPHPVLAEAGRRPYSEAWFRDVLAIPELPTEVKVAVAEALADSTPEAADLLLEVATGAEDPELRAAAVESLAWLDESAEFQDALLDHLESEPHADVRAELYRALAFDAGATAESTRVRDVVARVLSEREADARVQGFRLVAGMLRLHPDPHLAGIFDRDMVPWLWEEASGRGSRYSRLVSIDALKLANTSAATDALHDLSRSQEAAVAVAADHALFALVRLRD